MLIDFEGIDGSGKTTLSARLEARLRQLGHPVVHAGELGAAPAASERILAREASAALGPRAQLLLLAAHESERVEKVIRPALDRGEWVITDRYIYALLAAARHGWGLDDPSLPQVLELAAAGLLPDLVVLLDVQPTIARARSRCRGIASGEPARAGRFAEAGAGLLDRLHQELHALAESAPDRWLVLDNTWASLEEAEDALVRLVLERIERHGGASKAVAGAAGVWAPSSELGDERGVRASLLAACDAIAQREPPVAAHLLSGLSGQEIDERRLRLALLAPGVIAHGLTGLPGEGPMALRHALKAREPGHVASSLRGLADDEAWSLRLELLERAPGEVASSLEGLHDEKTRELRERLAERASSQVIASLRGEGSDAAWALREQLGEPAGPEALAASLGGLDSPRAWELRQKLLAHAPIAVVESLRGIGAEPAWQIRESFLKGAPRAVLESLGGLDEERAWRMREASGERMREALESTRGLDGDRAWAFRERMAPIWPGACALSLEGLAQTPRGRAVLFELLGRNRSDLDLLRAAAWVLDPLRAR